MNKTPASYRGEFDISSESDVDPFKADSRAILDFLRHSGGSARLRGAPSTALAYFLARAVGSSGVPFLLVAPSDREAESFSEIISFFLGNDNHKGDASIERRVRYFPSRAGRKAQSLGKMETTARRMEALYSLRASSFPTVTVTSALALMERLIPPEALLGHTEYVVQGEEIDTAAFCAKLTERGYYRVSLVEEYGDFSLRGGVLDLYAPLYGRPLRLEFFGDRLESIRLFHPSTQKSMGILNDALVLPGSEVILDSRARERAQKAIYEDVQREALTPAAGNVWLDNLMEGHRFGAFEAALPVFYEKTVNLWDYLNPGTVVVWSDAMRVRSVMEESFAGVIRDWNESRSPHEWKRHPLELYSVPEELLAEGERFRNLRVNSPGAASDSTAIFDLGAGGHEELALVVKSHSNKERLLEPLARQFAKWRRDGFLSFLVCSRKEQGKRLAELLNGYGVDASYSAAPFGEESFESADVKVLTGTLDRGFIWPSERLAVVSEEEIFGRGRRRSSRKTVSGLFLNSFQDLHVGDYIVHVDHGIGVYKELAHLNVRDIESDFLLLEYQDGDRLYVPVDKLRKVQKYLGLEGQEPKVDKLGGRSWETAKKKARESAERIAQELLKLYALRQVEEGFRFSRPDTYFHEFETTFTYEETPDQLKAIDDVLSDMTSARSMDRLVCGDVGYGKTEVALRAAFKAVMDGKQVAMLVPTTVLAEQHYQSILERFEGFPVEVASLSRFKTPGKQRKVIEGLRAGKVDIVVGTHRLLQKDIAFSDLGLLIIDEEHRFGVKHKEKLKSLRSSVDVLTLTATPIPRTLHMALSGIRDLSAIETAPQDRHAIETYISKYDDFTVREAIYRELHRGGQVFFVHNHVRSIHQMANSLGKLVPEARTAVAHGQMKERDLEKVMLDFIRRKIDLLVCTTIIESGLDIPAANTIIINRADKFGLAQIYQLRGRVGRSSEQAYAYLLIPDESLISRDAQKRLRALMDFSELGAGFKIALNDLQIRGGGTILGSSQSGHIAAVGYELYLELLEKTINEIKGEPAEVETTDPEMNFPLSAFLPESFIPDADQRLLAYKRLATVSENTAVDEVAAEWRDRYGPFPEHVKNLVLLAKTRITLRKSGVFRLDGEGESFALHFTPRSTIPGLLALLEEKKCSYQLETDRKLKIEIWGRTPAQRILRLKRILQEFCEGASDN